MIITAGIAGDFGTLDPAGVRTQIQVVHRHQNPPLRGLQTVAGIRKCAADDHAHRIGEIAVTHLILDVELLNSIVIGAYLLRVSSTTVGQ